ncbi:hypothetical protein ACQP2T_21340 [Nonomuraea sp. CA-143628]|uniref:hypothetical protein n=1 Tax=Nonomuraea sp. CA-143628 TaxID=3239997 RepID=UPI003D8A0128
MALALALAVAVALALALAVALALALAVALALALAKLFIGQHLSGHSVNIRTIAQHNSEGARRQRRRNG